MVPLYLNTMYKLVGLQHSFFLIYFRILQSKTELKNIGIHYSANVMNNINNKLWNITQTNTILQLIKNIFLLD